MMRCRAGDLAVVIKAANECNVVRIVSVLRLHDHTGDLVFDTSEPVWVVECAEPMLWTHGPLNFLAQWAQYPIRSCSPFGVRIRRAGGQGAKRK